MKTSFMIQGTSSSAGKSALTAGFLRYFSLSGYNSSPFKSQNMSLNSVVTEGGFEIAVSQAIQSEAAFKKPVPHINPILLKPSSENKIHLILQGKFYENTDFKQYNRKKNFFLKKARESFDILAKENDLIILEGAGSPAEINLFKFDIANMGFAEIYDIPVILVADIERGGVFASIFGTVKLLPVRWRKLIKGFIINKFRGDLSILSPGIKSMESKLKIPCLGVIPYIKDLQLEPEDSLNLKNRVSDKYDLPHSGDKPEDGIFKIGIVRLEHISNFNEFEPLFFDKRFHASFFNNVPDEIDVKGGGRTAGLAQSASFDMIIIPGTKSTAEDILIIKKSGVFDYINRFVKNGRGVLMGICGGFQMMGMLIKDPFHLESDLDFTEGFGFFSTLTVIEKEKRLLNQKYMFNFNGYARLLNGYEIHNGRTFFQDGYLESNNVDIYSNLFNHAGNCDSNVNLAEKGIISKDNKKLGTYIHGLFENDLFRDFIIDLMGKNFPNKTIKKEGVINGGCSYSEFKDRNYDLLAEAISKNVRCDLIKNFLV